jgi:hypothetical protein
MSEAVVSNAARSEPAFIERAGAPVHPAASCLRGDWTGREGGS